jgi:hypothetical protein
MPEDQPAKNRATTYRIHVLHLLSHLGWKQYIMQGVWFSVIELIVRNLGVDFVVLTKTLFKLMHK